MVCGRQNRTERGLHRLSVPQPSTPQPEMHVCWCTWRLSAETQALEDRSGERTVVGREETA